LKLGKLAILTAEILKITRIMKVNGTIPWNFSSRKRNNYFKSK
jgi:hypothetical protein